MGTKPGTNGWQAVLACFPERLHLGDGLMQPHERLFSFPYLLRVSLSLSACCLILLTELGLPMVQDLADHLRAGRGDRCRGLSSRTTCRCTRSQNRATRRQEQDTDGERK